MNAHRNLVLGIVLVLAGCRVLASRPPIAARPVEADFVFFADAEGQEHTRVPFAVGSQCATIYLESQFGVSVEKVALDGIPVVPVATDGIIEGPLLLLDRPGASFRYERSLDDLTSITVATSYSGRRFPVVLDAKIGIIEVTYRIRCADGSLSVPMVSRGKSVTLLRKAAARPTQGP